MKVKELDRIKTLPMPYRDEKFYNSVIQKGFNAFPKRKTNYNLYLESKRNPTLQYLPIMLDIENVSRCNFHCTMCQVSDWDKLKRADDMSLEDYMDLIDDQYGIMEIKLQGMGEPLLNAQDYFKMIKYARDRHIWVRSTVNGSLLHLKDNYKKLIDSDICELQISIDGTTKESFEVIRRGGSFERVKNNSMLINDYAQKVGKMRTRMWAVLQDKNFNDLTSFPVLAAELGFKRLTISLDLNDWGQDSWRKRNDPVDIHKSFDLETAQEIIHTSKALGVETTYWFIDEKYEPGNENKLCPWPFTRAFVSSDMRVVPCCMIANPEISDLGDARKFSKVWNNNRMQDFRLAHIEGRIPNICKSCYKSKN